MSIREIDAQAPMHDRPTMGSLNSLNTFTGSRIPRIAPPQCSPKPLYIFIQPLVPTSLRERLRNRNTGQTLERGLRQYLLVICML